MRLVKWNNPELEWNNNFSAHKLSNAIITTQAQIIPSALFREFYRDDSELQQIHERGFSATSCIFLDATPLLLSVSEAAVSGTHGQFNSCGPFQLIWP